MVKIWARLFLGPIAFIFMKFPGKFCQIIGWRPPFALVPPVWEILTPPLRWSIFNRHLPVTLMIQPIQLYRIKVSVASMDFFLPFSPLVCKIVLSYIRIFHKHTKLANWHYCQFCIPRHLQFFSSLYHTTL